MHPLRAFLLFLSFFIYLLVLPPALPPAHAQSLDSLKLLINNSKPDTHRVSLYLKLSSKYKNLGIYDTALIMADSGLHISAKLKFKNGIASSYYNIGIVYYTQGDYGRCMDFCLKFLKIKEETGDKKGIAYSYNGIGNVYSAQGDYGKCLDFYLKSLKILEEIGDKKGIADSYNNLGLVYDAQGDYGKCLDFYLKSLKIKEETGDKKGIAMSYNNIGVVYYAQGDYGKCLDFYLKSLKIKEETGDKKGIAASYNNIGLVYYAQGDYGRCLDFYLKSLKILEEIGNKKGIAVSQNNLAELHFLLRQYHEAIQYNQEAQQLSIELGSKDDIKISYQIQSRLDSVFSVTRQRRATGATGKSSYEHFVLARQYHDSLFSEENEKGMAKAETRYELYTVEKKQVEEERSRQSAVAVAVKKRNNIQYAGISVGIVVMFLAGWGLRRRRKRMSNDECRIMNDEVNVNASTFKRFNLSTLQLLNSSTLQHLLSNFNLQLFTLMVLFQFILLLMGPYVDAVSGGIPFYKVGINLGVSLLIFPVYNWLGKRMGAGGEQLVVGSEQSAETGLKPVCTSAVGSAINPKHNLFFLISILVLPLLPSFMSPQTSVTPATPPASQPNTSLLPTHTAYIKKINKYSTLTTAYTDSVAIYKNKNQWLVAREYYRKFSQWDDSLKLTKQAGELSKIEEKNRYKMEKLEAEYRAKEKAVQEAEKLQRRNLIQYSLIYIAVMALVVLVLLSGKIKMDARIGNVLIFVITLLSFETLLTATDPLTDTWSGGVPLFKLCMNIVLAGLVVPLHGWMEGRLGGRKRLKVKD